MKYKAVIFDLFGTLVDIFSRAEYNRVLREMAEALSAPVDKFSEAWITGGSARTTGAISSPMGSLIETCRSLNIVPTEPQLQRACRARLDYYKRNLKPRPDSTEVLGEIRAKGCLLGLLSNCASEIHDSWEQTPLSGLIKSPVFSCEVGMRKPDPRIYSIALGRLRVAPHQCLYVADGDSGELRGALDVGIDAVRLRVPYEIGADALRDNEEKWEGPTISSLKQVLELVQETP